MSRYTTRALRFGTCFPRSRGDEPYDGTNCTAYLKFSPLTRG